MNTTLEQIIKNSIVYTYVASQPFIAMTGLPVDIMASEQVVQNGDHFESSNALIKKEDIWFGENWNTEQYSITSEQLAYQIDTEQFDDALSITELEEMEKANSLSIIEDKINSIQPGMKSDNIKEVQKALVTLDYYSGEIDGIYGPLTHDALVSIEKDYDLSLVSEQQDERIQEIYYAVESSTIEESQSSSVETIESDDLSTNENNNDSTEEKSQDPYYSKQLDVSGNKQPVIKAARSLIGTPYVYGGDGPEGFDCSGFIQYVYESNDIVIPRTVSEIWNFSSPVDSPSIGDIVFFSTTHSGPSHAGIYIGDGQFIHAGSSSGVAIGELSNPYWEERYIGAKRI
ncbi:NlpC/P60 family protein [Oceanobacillus sp. 1P07AA]|uniref:C40 family peptidase n=1 Tax=Oceanobacillus sp. 1P07AA TaxID=3132293 RepID=UPI0039A5E448